MIKDKSMLVNSLLDRADIWDACAEMWDEIDPINGRSVKCRERAGELRSRAMGLSHELAEIKQ